MDVIFGLAVNEKLGDSIIVTVIATGFESNENKVVSPRTASVMGRAIQEDRTHTKKQSSIFDDDDYSDIPSFFRGR